MKKKTSEAQKKVVKKYANSKQRPNIFIDADKRELIETWFTDHGYKSFNEYVCALIEKDMNTYQESEPTPDGDYKDHE